MPSRRISFWNLGSSLKSHHPVFNLRFSFQFLDFFVVDLTDEKFLPNFCFADLGKKILWIFNRLMRILCLHELPPLRLQPLPETALFLLRPSSLDENRSLNQTSSPRSKGNWSSVRKTEASLGTRRTEGICFYVSPFLIPLLKGLFVCPFTNIYCKETACLCQRRKPSKQMANLIW
jgi:hypothetical protein